MNRLGTFIALGVAAVLAAGAGLASCGGDTGGTGGTCTPGTSKCTPGQACTVNIDCLAGLSCATAAGATSKTCQQVFVCTGDSQCTADRNPVCTAAGVCICLDGSCQQRGCSSDSVCEAGKICTGGTCTTRPASTGLACTILTPPSVVRQGQTVAFVAAAVNSNGAVVPGQTFTWASSVAGAAAIDAATGVVTGGTTTGTSNITCKVTGGSSTDSAAVPVQNYASVASGSVRAVVIDDRTGTPAAGAIVVFRQAGATVGSAITTGADGVATATATGAVDVHVFKNGYTYLSVIGTTTADLLIPLTPTPDQTKAGGFKGTFDLSGVANRTDTVEFGLAGASLGGPFIDLDFNKLIGESIKKVVKIGNLYDSGPEGVGLPSGLYLKLGDQSIKGDYAALAEGGKRHAWALGGKVPFDKLIQVLTPVLGGGGGLDNLPFGQIIAQVLPFFDKFRHFVKTDLQINETARVVDTGDINGNGSRTDLVADFGNATAFPTVNAVVNQALSLSTSVAVPTLPQYNGKYLEGAIVLAGANVVGRGLVPLGISAAVDAPKQGETADGLIDVDAVTAGNQSTVSFKMAPLHDGLEGSKYFVVTLALSLQFSASSLPSSISGIVTQTDRIEATTNLGGQTFLGFPTAASFTLASRTFNLGTAVAGATFYRADFKSVDGDWVVYFKAPASGAAFTLPAVPATISERAVQTSGCTGGAASCTSMRVFSLATKALTTGGTAPTLDDMAAFSTVNLRRLNDFVGAFSNASCQLNGSCAPPTP